MEYYYSVIMPPTFLNNANFSDMLFVPKILLEFLILSISRPSMGSPDPYSQQPMTPRPPSGGPSTGGGGGGTPTSTAPRSPSQGPTSPYSVSGGKQMPTGPGGLVPPSTHEGAQSPRHQPNSPIDPYSQQPGNAVMMIIIIFF